MITAHHLTDAVPAALFGIFALWAASSTRHWFVRLAVAAAALLLLLLIPAYEVVIILGCEMLVLVAGLALWRNWRYRSARSHQPIEKSSALRPRLSLATMMLLVVVVAVTTAVAARAPTWPWNRWLEMLGLGAAAGAFGLACVWVVCGHARLWLRLLAFPLLAIPMAASLQPFLSGPKVLRDWSQGRFRGWDHYWEAAGPSCRIVVTWSTSKAR